MWTAVGERVFDARLPKLQAVLDPQQLSCALAKVLPAEWGPFSEVRAEVVQHHRASRCTLQMDLDNPLCRRIIGKVYAKDRSDVYRAMQQISEAGFGPLAEFSIPHPLAYLEELNLLLQEQVSGTLVTEVFLKGTETEQLWAAQRCASWLATFHEHGPKVGPLFRISPELTSYWVRRLAKRAGSQALELMDSAMQLRERLDVIAQKLDTTNVCACHGTYCHYQIILSEKRIITLDWDGFCLSRPALDLARFIVVLKQLAVKTRGSLEAFAEAEKVFCETYESQSKINYAELSVYKAAHFLKHAKHHLKAGNGGVQLAQMMLLEGIRILAEER